MPSNWSRRDGFALAAALLLLNASLSFENVWPTPAIVWRGALSVELAICVLALALTRRLLSWTGAPLRLLAVVWTALVFGRYFDVTAPALYGRDVNLYWDARFMPDVAAMVVRVAPAWLIAVCLAAVVVIVFLMYRALRWALARLVVALAEPRPMRTITAMAIVAIAVFAVERTNGSSTVFAKPVTETYVHQARLVAAALNGSKSLAPSPTLDSDLSRVRGADVMVVFIESYGAVAFDRPELAGPLTAAREALTTTIRESGRDVVSAFVESPTFGGSSWLAHISLLSGVEVRDPDTNALLMAQPRDTMVKAFGRHGFRTVGLMPGLRQAWPEGSFYGFGEIYSADRLAYRGPEFGWFAIPDEYSLQRLNALEVAHTDRPPLFVFFPTISTHFPFSPTPPYQSDWSKMTDDHPYDGPAIVRAYAREPDWTNFSPGYVESMTYDYQTIGGFLSLTRGRDLVVILIGDHQPPAAVSGEHASWDVPVHIVASRREVIDRLVASGFRRGITPARPTLARMHALLPLLMNAFGDADSATH